jgi:hypothetical protein
MISITSTPVTAEEESSTGAEVNVLDDSSEIYGARVKDYNNVIFPRRALGKPDHFSAWLYRNGWIEIQLKETVTDCTTVNIWAGYIGWKNARIKVYTSSNGKQWKPAGNIKLNESAISRYTFNGDYGYVRYIKVKLTGSRWTLGMLDALSAKGGDVETVKNNDRY